MSNIDEFESIFRSALKDRFVLEDINIRKVLVLTDFNKAETEKFTSDVRSFLNVIDGEKVKWHQISGKDYGDITTLLKHIKKLKPDLICTFRNLHSDAWNFPHSLGEYLDVLTQQVDSPVFILPHPKATYAAKHAMKDTNTVMVVTDHLSTDHHLVNIAIKFTEEKGKLFLVHIEDEFHFKRVIDTISKIPEINTDDAENLIHKQLIKDAEDYIESCQSVLKESGASIGIKKIVRSGHHLTECKNIIDKNKIDLLVMNSKDNAQLAMHGTTYPLAVEIRNIPILMI